jgi:nitroimidazol reductase NimA-like FMN-containing flavoprotein (pyridoxamine 5'-phosphate oxidase superfamily)
LDGVVNWKRRRGFVTTPSDVDEFLARPLTAHLATVGPNVRPVWFLWEEEAFWVMSGPWSTVPAQVQENPHVALAVDICNVDTGETKQVVARGEAKLLPWDQGRGRRLLIRYLGDDVNTWDDRFRDYLSGEPGCVWVRIDVQTPRVVDIGFAASRSPIASERLAEH